MKKVEQQELDEIIIRLTNAFVIEQVFLWAFDWDNIAYYMLQILLKQQPNQNLVEANIYLASVVQRFEHIEFVICYPMEIKKKIRQGLGRPLLICQPGNLIYQHPQAKEPIKIPEHASETYIERTQLYIEKEHQKIHAFIEGYQFYLQKEHLGHAAFMLHQVIELAFRAAEHLMVGEEKRTHRLRTHQDYVAKFSRQLGNLFRTNGRNSVILQKLDEAYAAIRYEQDFKIKRRQLEVAGELAATMLAWLNEYSLFLLKEMKEHLLSNSPYTVASPSHSSTMRGYVVRHHPTCFPC